MRDVNFLDVGPCWPAIGLALAVGSRSHSRAHWRSEPITGSRARPFGVSSYSTRTGAPSHTRRATMPLASSSLSRIDSSRSEICGMPADSSEKRIGPESSECTIAPVHRLPSISTAAW